MKPEIEAKFLDVDHDALRAKLKEIGAECTDPMRLNIEMEGPDEAGLKDLAAKLGLDWSKVCHGSVEIVYRGEYDVTDEDINKIQVITFEEPTPVWLEQRRRA
ncbi:MAG TPA: hypothetical protein VIS56_00785 [Candidatus Saccharimonadales bacterium]